MSGVGDCAIIEPTVPPRLIETGWIERVDRMDPLAHADVPGALEKLLQRIPAYRGYAEREARRESDHLARKYMAEQLRGARDAIDTRLRELADAGQYDALVAIERVRASIDALEIRVLSAPRGYGGFFEYVQVDRKRLDDILFHDLDLTKSAEALRQLAEQFAKTAVGTAATPDLLAQISTAVTDLSRQFETRGRILAGTND